MDAVFALRFVFFITLAMFRSALDLEINGRQMDD